jgi:hypothetical protein
MTEFFLQFYLLKDNLVMWAIIILIFLGILFLVKNILVKIVTSAVFLVCILAGGLFMYGAIGKYDVKFEKQVISFNVDGQYYAIDFSITDFIEVENLGQDKFKLKITTNTGRYYEVLVPGIVASCVNLIQGRDV